MKFILTSICFLFFAFLPVNAVEEVILEIDDNSERTDTIESEDILINKADSLYDKIHKIKSKKYVETNKSKYLLDEILTKNFQTGPIESMHLFGYYRGYANMNISEGADTDYGFNAIYSGVNGRFRDGKSFYEAKFRFNHVDGYNFFQTLPVDIYVANTSIPHHTVILGNTRTPTGVEGSKSDSVIPLVARAQISRNFGDIRKIGIRVKGQYDLIDYDFGGYSSDTYFRKFFPGAEFSGWVTLKPLGKTKGKYGKLNLGGGVSAGKNDIDYEVYGLYVAYEYKKIMANFEYAKADGYNGARTISNNKAEGFYSTLVYKITPKIQLVARYDQYIPNKMFNDDIRREYSTGINYFIKGQALKLMLNYVFCQNDLLEDSHRIILGTQVML